MLELFFALWDGNATSHAAVLSLQAAWRQYWSNVYLLYQEIQHAADPDCAELRERLLHSKDLGCLLDDLRGLIVALRVLSEGASAIQSVSLIISDLLSARGSNSTNCKMVTPG